MILMSSLWFYIIFLIGSEGEEDGVQGLFSILERVYLLFSESFQRK